MKSEGKKIFYIKLGFYPKTDLTHPAGIGVGETYLGGGQLLLAPAVLLLFCDRHGLEKMLCIVSSYLYHAMDSCSVILLFLLSDCHRVIAIIMSNPIYL